MALIRKVSAQWGIELNDLTIRKYNGFYCISNQKSNSHAASLYLQRISKQTYKFSPKGDVFLYVQQKPLSDPNVIFHKNEFSHNDLQLITPFLIKTENGYLSKKNEEENCPQLFRPKMKSKEDFIKHQKSMLENFFGPLDFQLRKMSGSFVFINSECALNLYSGSLRWIEAHWSTGIGNKTVTMRLNPLTGNLTSIRFNVNNVLPSNDILQKPKLSRKEAINLVEEYFIKEDGIFEKYIYDCPSIFSGKYALSLSDFGKEKRREFFQRNFSRRPAFVFLQEYIPGDAFSPQIYDSYYKQKRNKEPVENSRIPVRMTESKLVYECVYTIQGENPFFQTTICVFIDAINGEYLGISDTFDISQLWAQVYTQDTYNIYFNTPYFRHDSRYHEFPFKEGSPEISKILRKKKPDLFEEIPNRPWKKQEALLMEIYKRTDES